MVLDDADPADPSGKTTVRSLQMTSGLASASNTAVVTAFWFTSATTRAASDGPSSRLGGLSLRWSSPSTPSGSSGGGGGEGSVGGKELCSALVSVVRARLCHDDIFS